MSRLDLDPAAPFLTAEARTALAALADANPAWRPWLAMLETALDAADRPDWRLATIDFSRARPEHAPILEGARIGVDGRAAAATLATLLAHALPDRAPAHELDALAVLEAGLSQDDARIGRLADDGGVPAPPLATVAHFAALPLLLEAGRRAAHLVPADWQAGYCPVCGAWPTLAELRGLERRRVLRCGRCDAGWQRAVLHCTYCDERDHRRQGALLPRDEGDFVRLDTCDACHGYLKVLTTLRAKPAWALPLEDLRLVPLELKAVERGFRRPDVPGWRLAIAVHAAEAG